MSHNWRSHVPIQYPGSASQLPFNQSSSGSKPGSLSGNKGIRLGLSSVRLIHSERDDADMSTERSSRVLTSQVETSRRALKRAQTKKKDKPHFPLSTRSDRTGKTQHHIWVVSTRRRLLTTNSTRGVSGSLSPWHGASSGCG